MGAISYAFDNVPAAPPALPDYPEMDAIKADPAAVASYEAQKAIAEEVTKAFRRRMTGIYGDLRARGLAVPAMPAEEITRDQLVAHLQEVVGAAVKQEVDQNRELYEALDYEQAALVLQRVGTLHGIPYAPNLLSPDDVSAALG